MFFFTAATTGIVAILYLIMDLIVFVLAIIGLITVIRFFLNRNKKNKRKY